jgi:hypothetical protein
MLSIFDQEHPAMISATPTPLNLIVAGGGIGEVGCEYTP